MQNFPDQVLNLCLLQWKLGVLTTRLPGKSKIPVSNKLYKSGIIVWLLFNALLVPLVHSANTEHSPTC